MMDQGVIVLPGYNFMVFLLLQVRGFEIMKQKVANGAVKLTLIKGFRL